MSRSNPTQTNPAKRFFKWSGSKGQLVYYDKEKQAEIAVKLPFTFLVLDQLSTITGFSEQDSSSYWSNEVRSVAKDELVVKTSNGTKQVGLYKDLADVRSKGAKYAKSIYIAYKDGDEFVMGNIKAAGAALTAWIEIKQPVAVGKITLSGSEQAKKGTTTYYTPTFEWSNAETDEDEAAVKLDKELQVYLSQYLTATHTSDNYEADLEEHTVATGLENARQVRQKLNAKSEREDDEDVKQAVTVGIRAEDEVNLDDIPF